MKVLNNKKGSAILWTVLLSVIITILLGAVMTASYAYFNYTMYTVKRQQAYFTARSAMDALLDEFANQNADEAEPDILPPYNDEHDTTYTLTDFSFQSRSGGSVTDEAEEMGEIIDASIVRPKGSSDRANISVTSRYVDQDYTVTSTVLRQPLYFAGIAIKNLTLNGDLNLGKNTDFYWNNTNTYHSKQNNYYINVNGNLVTKGDAQIYGSRDANGNAVGTISGGHRFGANAFFSKTGRASRQIWSPTEYIISNKTLQVFEAGAPEYSSSLLNTLRNISDTELKYCNNSAAYLERSFGYPGLLTLLGLDKIGITEESLLNTIGLGSLYYDLRNSSLSVADAGNDALNIRYIKVMSLSAMLSDTLQRIINQPNYWDIYGIGDAIMKQIKNAVDTIGLKALDLAYIDYTSSNINSWSDNVVPVVYLLVGQETLLSGNDLTVRVQYGKNPANLSFIGRAQDWIDSGIGNFLSNFLGITDNLAYVIVYLGNGCTLELGETMGTSPAQRTSENLIFAYSVYGESGSTLILNDGVTLLGEVQVDNLVINGNANVIYSTSNGSQVAKQKVSEYWTVVNYKG